MGSVIERGERNEAVFKLFRSDLQIDSEDAYRAIAGLPFGYDERDVYPDVRSCFAELKAQGLKIGVAGNQPAAMQPIIESLFPDVDFVGVSDQWGVSKPEPQFFERVISSCGFAPPEIAYVGDRVRYDIVPAAASGLLTVLVRRSIWGIIESRLAEAGKANLVIDKVGDLPAALAGIQPLRELRDS